jgi:hypothetical protein
VGIWLFPFCFLVGTIGAVGSFAFQHGKGGARREWFHQNGKTIRQLVPNFMTYHSAERISSGRALVTLQQLQIKVLARFTSQGCKIKFEKSFLSLNRKM